MLLVMGEPLSVMLDGSIGDMLANLPTIYGYRLSSVSLGHVDTLPNAAGHGPAVYVGMHISPENSELTYSGNTNDAYIVGDGALFRETEHFADCEFTVTVKQGSTVVKTLTGLDTLGYELTGLAPGAYAATYQMKTGGKTYTSGATHFVIPTAETQLLVKTGSNDSVQLVRYGDGKVFKPVTGYKVGDEKVYAFTEVPEEAFKLIVTGANTKTFYMENLGENCAYAVDGDLYEYTNLKPFDADMSHGRYITLTGDDPITVRGLNKRINHLMEVVTPAIAELANSFVAPFFKSADKNYDVEIVGNYKGFSDKQRAFADEITAANKEDSLLTKIVFIDNVNEDGDDGNVLDVPATIYIPVVGRMDAVEAIYTLPNWAEYESDWLNADGWNQIKDEGTDEYYDTDFFDFDADEDIQIDYDEDGKIVGIRITTRTVGAIEIDYTVEPCTVSFADEIGNGAETGPVAVDYGGTYLLEVTPADGSGKYDFVGWAYNGLTYALGTSVSFGEAQEATLTAVWKEKTYTVTFDPNGGSVVRSTKTLGVVTDKSYGALPTPKQPSYALEEGGFAGWFDAKTGGNPITEVSDAPGADQTLYAHWNYKSFTVTENGTETGSGTYGTDYSYTIPEYDPTKTYDVSITIGGKPYYGAEFNAETGTYTVPGEAITGEVVITSELADENYTVLSFSFDGKVVYTTKVLKDSEYPTAEEVTLPTKTGYNVTGWFTDEACTQEATGTVDAAKTLYAKATVKSISVSFDGGASASVNYGEAIPFPENPDDTATQNFLGWKGSNDVFIPRVDAPYTYSYTMPDVDALTFEPIWQQIGALTITVKDTNGAVEGATVNLMQNGMVVKSVVTDAHGAISFDNLPYGAYNVEVISSVNETETVTTTVGKDITGTDELTVTVPTVKLNTVVETEVEMNITSENLENAIKKNEKPTANGSTEVTITLNAKPSDDADKDTIDAAITKNSGDKQIEMVDYVDLTVTKTTQNYTADGTPDGEPEDEPLETTEQYQIISIEISNGLYQKMLNNGKTVDNVLIYQLHNGEAKQLKKTSYDKGKNASVDCYWIKTVEGKDYIVLRTKNFSTYAIGYQDEEVKEENVPQESSGSSGGGGASHSIGGANTENGKITLSRKNAAPGQTVKITVTPDEGYALDQLTVLDKNGNALELTKIDNSTYSFRMPSGKVTVSATFKPAEGESDEPVETVCPRDASCPIEPFAETTIVPTGTATRAEAATMVQRFCENVLAK